MLQTSALIFKRLYNFVTCNTLFRTTRICHKNGISISVTLQNKKAAPSLTDSAADILIISLNMRSSYTRKARDSTSKNKKRNHYGSFIFFSNCLNFIKQVFNNKLPILPLQADNLGIIFNQRKSFYTILYTFLRYRPRVALHSPINHFGQGIGFK